jgi:hypothetical protein
MATKIRSFEEYQKEAQVVELKRVKLLEEQKAKEDGIQAVRQLKLKKEMIKAFNAMQADNKYTFTCYLESYETLEMAKNAAIEIFNEAKEDGYPFKHALIKQKQEKQGWCDDVYYSVEVIYDTSDEISAIHSFTGFKKIA